ncbi:MULTISPECIES: M28 family metallopeptidase [Streptomyces]|uniref:Aminopeptidase Y (Arg, Lys, Leu preference) n=1 Tax=Streptomyces venezuelae (strain ATCC 10712 / CBS 650.69 / DSM 40230 / JCM 4526 / NBRC 13096 / PD 04745) TaxID=953739 RepID=F2REF9_STRVP|nr:M28 family metallopeptidase [Streptomyces venezuelae]APE22832.1 amidohydrolase [Streptomyces venezuelae]QES00212.1 M28 family peptidase [Streptomyces venezuelae ATCC 10712]CCA57082.1 Aminopeptidase Y (Arg, Lys, Leu preference) [Streptomyces venezuelae ATCC 10712]
MNATQRRAAAVLAAAALATPLVLASPATAGQDPTAAPARDAAKLAKKLVRETSAQDAYKHLQKFQAIADSAGGHRAAGSLGHDASAAYVYTQLKKAGYDVRYQKFDFEYTETLAEKASVVSPAPRTLDIKAMTYTKSTPVGGITAALAAVPVDADGTTGCEPGDFASGTFTGKIALIKRGGCTFAVKQQNAAAAGAAAAVIYNNTAGALSGTLGDAASGKIPTGGLTQAQGEQLAADLAAGPVSLSLEIRQLQQIRSTNNVIAETRGGNAANTVMLGSHLDSVTAGPGINDNGSGSAGLLQTALELAKSKDKVRNKVRFAWWSAEENGLLGSEHYVKNLSSLDKNEIKLYLNFDMIASPNYGLFVYDGDDSDATGAGAGPAGSAQLERDITDFMDKRGVPHEGTDFTGRSDYGPFIEVGIPSGGTFTGAEGIKTAGQAAKFGGTAGVAYDVNYHAKGDDLKNINMTAFDVNIDVIANAVGTYAHDISSLRKPVVSVPTTGDAGSGGGLHADHDEVTS